MAFSFADSGEVCVFGIGFVFHIALFEAVGRTFGKFQVAGAQWLTMLSRIASGVTCVCHNLHPVYGIACGWLGRTMLHGETVGEQQEIARGAL
jgi:hypothetical protein